MLNHRRAKLVLFMLLILPLPLRAEGFANMIVFGDSISDNGNLATIPAYDFLNHPPYQQGFSNGPLAVQSLAAFLDLPLKPSLYFTGVVAGTNFAVAGADAGGNSIIDLSTQVDAFLQSESGLAADANLYVLFIGGNDLREIRDQPDERAAAILMNNALQSISSNLRKLIKAGATHLLLVNAPDISILPETIALAAKGNNPALLTRAAKKSHEFNHKLDRYIARIEHDTEIDMIVFDLPVFIATLQKNRRALGFNNIKDACYSSASFTYYPVCDEALMDRFMFFDEIHPTQNVHTRLARALFAVVPSP